MFSNERTLNVCFLYFFAFLKFLGDAKLKEKIQKNILRKFFGKFRQCGIKTFLEKRKLSFNKLF